MSLWEIIEDWINYQLEYFQIWCRTLHYRIAFPFRHAYFRCIETIGYSLMSDIDWWNDRLISLMFEYADRDAIKARIEAGESGVKAVRRDAYCGNPRSQYILDIEWNNCTRKCEKLIKRLMRTQYWKHYTLHHERYTELLESLEYKKPSRG